MLLSLLETILVMHLLEREDSSQSASTRDRALRVQIEANGIFPNVQGGESRNLEKPELGCRSGELSAVPVVDMRTREGSRSSEA